MRLKLLRAGAITGLATLALLALNSHVVNASSQTPAAAADCGGDHRWDVKTLSDNPGADLVHYDTPKRHSIKFMLGRVDPHVGTHTARDADRSHIELTVYRLIGVRLFNARIEEDGDVHLVIQDKYERKMIVEFPNTLCKGAKDSAHKDEMKQARDDFATLCGMPTWRTRTTKANPRELSGSASLEGVGFFDLKHGTPQVGVAANNIELHPVLKFSTENCHPT
jgi:hypothetical protein